MFYTHDLPKTEGYYWYKKYPSWKAVIVEVVKYEKTGELMQDGWRLMFWTYDGKSQWSSEPIPEPLDTPFDSVGFQKKLAADKEKIEQIIEMVEDLID